MELNPDKNTQKREWTWRDDIVSIDGILTKFSVRVVPYSYLELSTRSDYNTASQKTVQGFLHRLCCYEIAQDYLSGDTEEIPAGMEFLSAEEFQSVTVTL